MNDFYSKNIIFPHITTTKQRKEVPFLFCYNIRLVDLKRTEDTGFKAYLKSLIRFTDMTFQNSLVRNELADVNLKIKMRDTLFRTDGGNSATVDIKYISSIEKKEFDEFLILSNYHKKLDKYSFIYEGCPNDDKLFLGGKNEMYIHFCRLFPNAKECLELKKKFSVNQTEKNLNLIFGNAEMADKIMDGMVRFFDRGEDLNENK